MLEKIKSKTLYDKEKNITYGMFAIRGKHEWTEIFGVGTEEAEPDTEAINYLGDLLVKNGWI